MKCMDAILAPLCLQDILIMNYSDDTYYAYSILKTDFED